MVSVLLGTNYKVFQYRMLFFVSHKNISVSDVKICGFSISVNPVLLGFGGLSEAQNGKVGFLPLQSKCQDLF